MIGATHTHAGPGQFVGTDFYNRFASNRPGFDPEWTAFLVDQVADAVERAVGERRPARMAIGTTDVWGVTRNRSLAPHARNPEVDHRTDVHRRYAEVEPRLHLVRVDSVDDAGGTHAAGRLGRLLHPRHRGVEPGRRVQRRRLGVGHRRAGRPDRGRHRDPARGRRHRGHPRRHDAGASDPGGPATSRPSASAARSARRRPPSTPAWATSSPTTWCWPPACGRSTSTGTARIARRRPCPDAPRSAPPWSPGPRRTRRRSSDPSRRSGPGRPDAGPRGGQGVKRVLGGRLFQRGYLPLSGFPRRRPAPGAAAGRHRRWRGCRSR